MKSLLKKLGAGAAMVVAPLAMVASAQAAQDSFDATANIITAITITNQSDLSFGDIVPHAANPDSVTIAPGGGRTCGTDLGCSGTSSAAQFDITGAPSTAYTITLPGNSTISNGSQTMDIRNFAHSAGGSPTLDGTGNHSFTVGATLDVLGGQATGAYTGNFSVTVDYQ